MKGVSYSLEHFLGTKSDINDNLNISDKKAWSHYLPQLRFSISILLKFVLFVSG